MKVSCVFVQLCVREIRIVDLHANIIDAVEALCLLEKVFPPSFMDVMFHLIIHLVQELYISSPMHCKWMYPIERYIKTLKDFVRIYANLKASMAKRYMITEALNTCSIFWILDDKFGMTKMSPICMMKL
jgi:hypothetical protein